MSQKMEKQWGDLESYTGIGTSRSGQFQVAGLQVGNVFLGVQPVLGLEGDPMRLLFERDLTPHPQYAAFYQHIQEVVQPHCIIHFGTFMIFCYFYCKTSEFIIINYVTIRHARHI